MAPSTKRTKLPTLKPLEVRPPRRPEPPACIHQATSWRITTEIEEEYGDSAAKMYLMRYCKGCARNLRQVPLGWEVDETSLASVLQELQHAD